jgi:hypothetical protein
MPALPPIEDLQSVDFNPNALSAYNICIDLERRATTEQSRIHARVLGYLIIHAPSVTALHEVVKVIHSYARDFQSLFDLGESFINYFIRPCKFSIRYYPSTPTLRLVKKAKGRTPATSDHPSRPSFGEVSRELKERSRGAPKDHKEAKSQVSGYLMFK